MKNSARSFLFFLAVLSLSQCTSRKAAVTQINRSLDSIDVIFTDPKLDSEKIFSLSNSINDFIKKYPDDSLSPKYLLALGITCQKAGMYMQAISDFQQLQKKYPTDQACQKALFYQAFLYANVINRLDSAKILYELYVRKYGNRDSSTTKIVESELKYLGKSPAEILSELKKDSEKKN